MAGWRVCGSGRGSSKFPALPQNQRDSSSEPLDALLLSGSSPFFLGSSSMVSFEDAHIRKRSDRSFLYPFDQDENGDEDLDEYFHQPGKKRRLTADQVQFLERTFEVENKLEPERKVQLAKGLGLQPRQVAIWFQNRRARWKTKQLERDYEALQASCHNLKADFESLLKEKEKLKAEVDLLTNKLLFKEKGSEHLDSTNKLAQAGEQNAIADSDGEDKTSIVGCKKDPPSAKSDVVDSGSPRYADGGHSSLSQDEEDNTSKSLLHPSSFVFPKLEDTYYADLPGNSCNLGFPVEDNAHWFWSY